VSGSNAKEPVTFAGTHSRNRIILDGCGLARCETKIHPLNAPGFAARHRKQASRPQKKEGDVNDFGSVGESCRQYSSSVRGRLRHDIVFAELSKSLKERASILDVGCGDGEMSLRLARAGHAVLGIDPSPGMLEIAHLRLEKEPAEIAGRMTFSQGDLFTLDLNDEFDCARSGIASNA
jgi:2-polyprenyl-3-methyl-5-hydroxy-6-metoxy-1,4-benzoquinol methylase